MRSLALIFLLVGCKADDVLVDTSGLVDTDDPVDTDPPDPVDAWWDDRWPYRVQLAIAGTRSIDGVPLTPVIDFAALLDEAGDPSGLAPESLRVVSPDHLSVWPAQFLDDRVDLMQKSASEAPVGDDVGAVAFVADGAWDVSVRVFLYFGSHANDPGDPLSPALPATVPVGVDGLRTGAMVANFDRDRGGLLADLTAFSTVLTSQADSDYGNGLNGQSPPGGWNMSPQDLAAGGFEVLSSGPVAAGVRATGLRSNDQAGYSYSYEYWAFAGQPELWVRIHAVTTRESLEQHPLDFTRGMRPWQSRQDALVDSGQTLRREIGAGDRWASIASEDVGVVMAWHRAPNFAARVINSSDDGFGESHRFLSFEANDYMPLGLGTPHTIPDSVAFFDHDLLVVSPFLPDDTTATDAAERLIDGIAVTVGPLELR